MRCRDDATLDDVTSRKKKTRQEQEQYAGWLLAVVAGYERRNSKACDLPERFPSDRAARPAAEGMFTVAQLADRGIHPMTDDEIRAVTVGRTVPVGEPRHRVRGHPALRRGREPVADGPRRPPGRHALRDPRRPAHRDHAARRTDVHRAVRRRRRTLAARDDEAGYVNYEAFTTS